MWYIYMIPKLKLLIHRVYIKNFWFHTPSTCPNYFYTSSISFCKYKQLCIVYPNFSITKISHHVVTFSSFFFFHLNYSYWISLQNGFMLLHCVNKACLLSHSPCLGCSQLFAITVWVDRWMTWGKKKNIRVKHSRKGKHNS